ncbi:RdgB/HAM1 family non-canonical purine NTP pyrophosphatase [Candidatus Acetothermia bacterium]|nr:RdgB/HAM1 family non-canonical purine NTP pyrophosphatase [Candidatus Acetothermia bacterium]MBI3643234.1 RdgB/HAM1 family non-canonical purine NTP pyrophosphatase [Candidatus Acetothermia bacterium]
MKILLGTKNPGKIKEILSFFFEVGSIEWLTFADCPFAEVNEDGSTFQENALKKARQISHETGLAVLAEDSGLEVLVLKGAPGVRSARFAGEKSSDAQNIHKLLALLEHQKDRQAQFTCCAVLVASDGREWHSDGVLHGEIALEPKGTQGFGYDPIFIPSGHSKTLGELGQATKDLISHRRKALEGLKSKLVRLSSEDHL